MRIKYAKELLTKYPNATLCINYGGNNPAISIVHKGYNYFGGLGGNSYCRIFDINGLDKFIKEIGRLTFWSLKIDWFHFGKKDTLELLLDDNYLNQDTILMPGEVAQIKIFRDYNS